ncbi:hypothetical protein RND81_05G100300 [Saponaria officinalis]|uniref:Fungal lipase-type domain-containing protein n=1 Tax=Saponaria officinalis TaxID=3572 RepID=A0AAW1KRP3_SAPOF
MMVGKEFMLLSLRKGEFDSLLCGGRGWWSVQEMTIQEAILMKLVVVRGEYYRMGGVRLFRRLSVTMVVGVGAELVVVDVMVVSVSLLCLGLRVMMTKLDHKRTVIASLVRGVYIIERDRQKGRTGHDELGPIWSEFFHFWCIEKLKDERDDSIIGAIFEYKSPNHRKPIQGGGPPKYIIAFRGTFLKWRAMARDMYTDTKLALNTLTKSSRYRNSLETVQALIAKSTPNNVWLAGHSLGAALALQIGKNLAQHQEYNIVTYLFNPPFLSFPIEKLPIQWCKTAFRMASALITLRLNANASDSDLNTLLRPWVPFMFINKNDLLGCKYLGYFKYREYMASLVLDSASSVASRSSFIGLPLDVGDDKEAIHQLPSAYVVENLIPMEGEFMSAHSLHQWWQTHTKWSIENTNFPDIFCITKLFIVTICIILVNITPYVS